MGRVGYYEELENRLRIRHFFFPGPIYFAGEALVAVIALLFLNLSTLGNRLLSNNADRLNPVEYVSDSIASFWTWLNGSAIFENFALFVLWAVVGALAYLLVFRLIQIGTAIFYSAEDAKKLIKAQREFGLVFWLISLDNFFKRSLISLSGVALIVIGAFICFSFASSQLRSGLFASTSDAVLHFLISFAAAAIGIRILVSGIGLLIPAFRRWYYA